MIQRALIRSGELQDPPESTKKFRVAARRSGELKKQGRLEIFIWKVKFDTKYLKNYPKYQ